MRIQLTFIIVSFTVGLLWPTLMTNALFQVFSHGFSVWLGFFALFVLLPYLVSQAVGEDQTSSNLEGVRISGMTH